jgi:hypothetical protein
LHWAVLGKPQKRLSRGLAEVGIVLKVYPGTPLEGVMLGLETAGAVDSGHGPSSQTQATTDLPRMRRDRLRRRPAGRSAADGVSPEWTDPPDVAHWEPLPNVRVFVCVRRPTGAVGLVTAAGPPKNPAGDQPPLPSLRQHAFRAFADLEAAFAVSVAYYNYYWQTRMPGNRGTKRPTACMMAGRAGHVWSFGELFEAVLLGGCGG